jgi:sulfur carrier protein ThiS
VPAKTKIFFYGSLGPSFANVAGERAMEYALEDSLPLKDLLDRFSNLTAQVQLVMVNHKAVPPDFIVSPGDRIALFPREYMIFADWKNLRF